MYNPHPPSLRPSTAAPRPGKSGQWPLATPVPAPATATAAAAASAAASAPVSPPPRVVVRRRRADFAEIERPQAVNVKSPHPPIVSRGNVASRRGPRGPRSAPSLNIGEIPLPRPDQRFDEGNFSPIRLSPIHERRRITFDDNNFDVPRGVMKTARMLHESRYPPQPGSAASRYSNSSPGGGKSRKRLGRRTVNRKRRLTRHRRANRRGTNRK